MAGGDRLAQRTCRKQPFVLELARPVEHQYVQITGELQMLKAVIQYEYIDGLLTFQAASRCKSIRTYSEHNPAAETPLQQLHLVAAITSTLITAAENSNPFALRHQPFGEP